ncbi:MAG: hypothetical protein WCD70_09665 [Alphaproteobacteria bacterium]
MSVENQARLRDIATLVMSAWIRQEIFNRSERKVAKPCDGSVECVVGEKLDWRRDHLNMLHLAANFRSLDDYQTAIAVREQAQIKARSLTKEVLKDVVIASTREDFSNAVTDLLRPFVLICETSALKELAYVYACLSGEMAPFSYDKEPKPGGMLADKVTAAFATLKELGHWPEWTKLIENQPAPAVIARNAALKQFHPI